MPVARPFPEMAPDTPEPGVCEGVADFSVTDAFGRFPFVSFHYFVLCIKISNIIKNRQNYVVSPGWLTGEVRLNSWKEGTEGLPSPPPQVWVLQG